MKSIGKAPRQAGVALVVLATSCAIAACGSSSAATTKATASASNTSTTSRTALRTCLQKHGVTLPNRRPGGGAPGSGGPPPGGGPPGGGPPGGGSPGGGGFFGGGGGGQFANPKFRAAFQACGGGHFRGARRFRGRISHTAINNYVACVRKHGYPQMPSPNFSGKGPVFPSNIRTNSKFQGASRACASTLVPARPSGTSTNPGA